MYIDCRRCLVRGSACATCVISSLLDAPGTIEWDDTERAAIASLANSGLIPPLRLKTGIGCVDVT